jgi:hypothetical protein
MLTIEIQRTGQEPETREVSGHIDAVLAEIIENYLDHAQLPTTDPAESWSIVATVHLSHDAGGTCDVTCTVVPLPLPNVGLVREAQRDVDEYFRTNPPAEAEFQYWRVEKVLETEDTIFAKVVAP